MVTTRGNISPLGEGASEGAARRRARSGKYRAQHDELAPYRVIARAVILGRADKGITQEELGSAIGTTGSAISRIESGKRSVTLDTLGKLGAALEITFVVGSPSAANDDCVVVPRRAIEVPRDALDSQLPAGNHTRNLLRSDP